MCIITFLTGLHDISPVSSWLIIFQEKAESRYQFLVLLHIFTET